MLHMLQWKHFSNRCDIRSLSITKKNGMKLRDDYIPSGYHYQDYPHLDRQTTQSIKLW